MSQISDLLVQRLVGHLELTMQTQVAANDPARAGEVKAYRFQDNPVNKVNYCWVGSGDPNDPSFRDGLVTADQMEDLRMDIPVGEIGGGHYWWRRGKVTIGCYFIAKGYDQNKAGLHAHTFLGRVQHNTENTNVADLVDEYGERAYFILVPNTTFFEGGGPPNQYIWRGTVAWQVLTHRP